MEGFDEGTSQQSGIHPLQRIGNCYFRDKNTIYYFWNASLQQINKLRIHLFFLFFNLIYTYVLQLAGSTERCAHYLSKKSVPHQIAHSILEAIWGDPLVYLKKKTGNFGCNKLNPAVTTSVGHADLVDSVGQRCMVSFVWPHPSMRGQRWWQFGLAKREPDGGWVARAGTSSDSDSPDKLQLGVLQP